MDVAIIKIDNELIFRKKFKTKSCTYAFSSSEKQILVKKKNFFGNFFPDFFQIFFEKMGKIKKGSGKVFKINS